MTNDPQRQPYDSALKSVMDDHAAEMLPEILPECVFLSEKNAEIARTNLRPDLVYLIEYKGKHHILDLELQTSEDHNMTYRMLLYFVELLGKYGLPVISMVIYPFETSIPEPVLRQESGDGTMLMFQHQVLRLWTLDAEQYVRRHVVSMYTLLPAMKAVHASMLLQAMKEMEQQYQGSHLARHLVRFRTILRRSTTLSAQDKQIVEDRLHMYDSLLDQDPDVQARVARAKIEGQQQAVIDIVEIRFPALLEEAQQKVIRLNVSDQLSLFLKQMVTVSDETTARWLLSTLAA